MSNQNPESKALALVTQGELSLVESNLLNKAQLSLILRKTPAIYVHKRPAKGGGTWDYVTGGYVKKCLNLMFGWDWDFEIVEQLILHGEAVVKGRLTCRIEGKAIVKTQFGNKEIMYKKQPDDNGDKVPLSIGNDLKAAATDCLKKCAAEIGIAADIYNKEDFNDTKVVDPVTLDELRELYVIKINTLTKEETDNCERIINTEEKKSYLKLHQFLLNK